MESSKLKNMVILRNLPSNLVEEAIVVLKSGKKVKKLEKIEKNRNAEGLERIKKDNSYVLKEAEMLISNYIVKLENNKHLERKKSVKHNKKYIRLKNYAYIASFVILVQMIMLLS